MAATFENNANLVHLSRLKLNAINRQKRFPIQDARFATFNSLEMVSVHSYMMLKLVAAFSSGIIDAQVAKSFFGLNVGSAGVHTMPNVSAYTINGQTFEFEEGKQVRCASWAHICAAFDRMVDILDEVVMSPRVRGIAKVLPWQFLPI